MMKRLLPELRFIQHLIGLNLASAMEYRASFIVQILGMFINNGIYFVFWVIFFDRFGDVRGYEMRDVILLFAVVAMGFGLSAVIAGNTTMHLARIIATGRLDYYLVFPRNLLGHVIFSRMGISGIGDIAFGLSAFLFAGYLAPSQLLLYCIVSICAALVLTGFGIITGSLAFYMGNAEYASTEANMAMMTFSLYPNTLFSGMARVLIFTLIPAGFVGAIPVEIIKSGGFSQLPLLLLATAIIWATALGLFYYGLRRYESGSAINLNM